MIVIAISKTFSSNLTIFYRPKNLSTIRRLLVGLKRCENVDIVETIKELVKYLYHSCPRMSHTFVIIGEDLVMSIATTLWMIKLRMVASFSKFALCQIDCPWPLWWPLVRFDIGDQTNSEKFCSQHLPQGEEEGW